MAIEIPEESNSPKKDFFTYIAEKAASGSGSPWASLLATLTIVVWGILGPMFHYSDTWQLVINTGTTIITFLMVFLIQNTQNRDSKAMQLKLDELIRATEGAHTVLLDLEELSDKELKEIRDKYEKIAAAGRKRLRSGGSDTNNPDITLEQ